MKAWWWKFLYRDIHAILEKWLSKEELTLKLKSFPKTKTIKNLYKW